MGENSAIEWTTHTYNPWQGCHKVSAGCKNCYMFREKERYGQEPSVVVRSKPATFNSPLKWKEPSFVFTCSWSDFFIEEADPWRDDAWNVIRQTPHLTYQILTKRPSRIPMCLPADWGNGWPNVWLGVTVEDHHAFIRISQLLQHPASLYFVSFEPALENIDWRPWLRYGEISWLIAGCESGPKARMALTDWFRVARDASQEFGTAFFLKQMMDRTGHLVKMPLLDGRKWDQMPEVTHA